MTKRSYSLEDIQSAHFATPPAFANRSNARKGAKAEGLRYERRAQEHLELQSGMYLPSPWLLYVTEGRPFWCQPDGLHFDVLRGHITICEIKLKHTADSHRQLRGVYEPVVRRMFARPAWGVSLVEVVKWYDPDVRYPEPHSIITDPFNHVSNKIGVYVWRP